MTNSLCGSVRNWYLAVTSRFWNPLWLVAPGSARCVQVEPIEVPKLSVIRLEYSTATSVWIAGGLSPVRNQSRVGMDSSSATHGSSIASVAGKNRPPTKQCANALLPEMATTAAASAAAPLMVLNMENLRLGWTCVGAGFFGVRAHTTVKRRTAARATRKETETLVPCRRCWRKPAGFASVDAAPGRPAASAAARA